jgi:hypothetical protein
MRSGEKVIRPTPRELVGCRSLAGPCRVTNNWLLYFRHHPQHSTTRKGSATLFGLSSRILNVIAPKNQFGSDRRASSRMEPLLQYALSNRPRFRLQVWTEARMRNIAVGCEGPYVRKSGHLPSDRTYIVDMPMGARTQLTRRASFHEVSIYHICHEQ